MGFGRENQGPWRENQVSVIARECFQVALIPTLDCRVNCKLSEIIKRIIILLEDCFLLTADSPHIWETSSLYCSSFLPSALWAYYGLIKPDGFLIVSVNIFGISLQICYLTIFLLFSPPNMRVRTATLVAIFNVGFVGATILISYLMLHGSSRIEVIGFICAALNIMNCGSPLGIARKVVRTRSVEYMPFLLTLCIFLNSGVWTFYAVLVKDPYIGVPNLIGFLLGVMQLVIYVIYMNESKSSKEDHSSIHDQLLPSHSDKTCDLLLSHSESNSSKIVLKITT